MPDQETVYAMKGKPVQASALSVGDVTTPLVSQTHIADPAGGATVDAEARTAINAILARLEAFGLSKTS